MATADLTHEVTMDKITSLAKRRGFVFQSSEIYGGQSGAWDYGPLGIELKNRIQRFWWKEMTQLHDNIVGLDAAILMHPRVWEASGHVANFTDPLVDCKKCKQRFRADLLDEAKLAAKVCPECGGQIDNGHRPKMIAEYRFVAERQVDYLPGSIGFLVGILSAVMGTGGGFIMIPAKKQDLFYPRQKLPDQETEARLVDTLKSIATLRGECWLTDEAGKLYDSLALKFYGKHHMNGNLCSPFYPRLINYALKFSMLNSCINQHYPNILEMDVEMAWDTIRRLTKAINDIVENEVTFSPEQANRKRVYDYLKHDYPRAVSWSELLRYTKLKTADLREATDALLQGDQIDEVKDDGPNGPGRPKRSFKFIKQEEEPDLGEQENEN